VELDAINSLNNLVNSIEDKRKFLVVVLANEEGLPVAYNISGDINKLEDVFNPDVLAAISADLTRLFGDKIFVSGRPKEIIVEYEKAKVYFKLMNVDGHYYMFSVIIPKYVKYFKRDAKQIARKLQRILILYTR